MNEVDERESVTNRAALFSTERMRALGNELHQLLQLSDEGERDNHLRMMLVDELERAFKIGYWAGEEEGRKRAVSRGHR